MKEAHPLPLWRRMRFSYARSSFISGEEAEGAAACDPTCAAAYAAAYARGDAACDAAWAWDGAASDGEALALGGVALGGVA